MLSNVPARFAETAAGMAIDRKNVVQVGKILHAEADRLQDAIDGYITARVGLCGGDPVSEEAAAAFNERATLLWKSFQLYVDDLRELARSVVAAASAYEIAEADIAGGFRR